ncbi:hypothetical protein [Christiangramia salexigens]|uniref:Uncharacterized protein n=1 Tax=Christiangramia salexigens TaxID=1913577 RepID=A0A1L3J6S2_9FLAO|nr:hypothetical protein [Christiangramia salexigens]APG60826.1 hypothetical protein LPB144_10600 [Christiangramia salexigens]
MKNQLLPFLKYFIPFSFLLLAAQYAIVNYMLDVNLYYSTLSVYLFHILATFLIYILLVFVHKTFSDKTGFAFMGLSLLKMLAAVIFLLPIMLNDAPNPFQDMIAFFVPYFLFLIFETTFAVRLINFK